MSIAEQQEKIKLYLTDAYNACNEQKATIPSNKNLQSLGSCIRSIKGGGESGGGSSSYNVYCQMNEPTDKNGVWVKENSGSGEPKVYFSLNASSKGEFISSDAYSFLKKSTNPQAMCVVGKYLYVFGTNTSSSYIYNLQTKQYIGNINFPSSYTGSPFGAYEYLGKIFVFLGTQHRISYFVYDIETNTSSDSVVYTYTTGSRNYFISGRYGDEVYIYWSGYSSITDGCKLNLETKTFSGIANPSSSELVYNGMYSFTTVGNKIYIYCYSTDYSPVNYRLATIEMGSNTFTYQANMFGKQQGCIYGQGDYLYMFPNGANETTYYRYHLIDKTLETITTRIPYSSTFSSGKQPMVYEEITGLLYFINGAYSPSVMQFGNSPLTADLDIGTVVIAQAFNSKATLIKNSDNLFVCVGDTFIMRKTVAGEVLDGEHVSFYGDGEVWHLLKNPTGETAIVTFDTDGGGEIESQEVVLGQKLTSVGTPTKTGYAFLGWYKDGEPFNFSTPIVGNMTLTAMYEEIMFVEYIESSGTQYIDTGIVPKSTTKVEVQMSYTASGSTQVSGWGSSASAESFFWGVNSANKFVVSVSPNYTAIDTGIVFDTQPHVYTLESGSQSFDGVVVGTDTIGNTATTGQTMYLFGLHAEWQTSGAASSCSARMYYCKIYDGDTLVRDYKPALDSNGVACLYDTVTDKYCYNAGTGSFLEPYNINDYTQLSYIEGTGTQYIDTGVMPDNNTILQVDYSITATSFTGSNTLLFKAHGSATEPSFNMVCAGGGGNTDNARVTFGATYSYFVDFTGLKNNNRHNIEINCPSSKVIVDNVSTYSVKASTFACTKTLKIFGDTGTFVGRVYSCKIYDNNVLVRNLIPVKHRKNNIIGLYDTVNDILYTNKGTGSFTAG